MVASSSTSARTSTVRAVDLYTRTVARADVEQEKLVFVHNHLRVVGPGVQRRVRAHVRPVDGVADGVRNDRVRFPAHHAAARACELRGEEVEPAIRPLNDVPTPRSGAGGDAVNRSASVGGRGQDLQDSAVRACPRCVAHARATSARAVQGAVVAVCARVRAARAIQFEGVCSTGAVHRDTCGGGLARAVCKLLRATALFRERVQH